MVDSDVQGFHQNETTEVVLQVGDFDPLVGKTARFAGTAIVLTLDHILCDRERAMPDYIKRRPFILIFCGPRRRDLPHADLLTEGLYVTTFEDGSSYEIYIAPIHTAEPHRQLYQVIVN